MSKKKLGVHSEAGKLHKVMVCSPGLAHLRLTPNNCDELLFDDVIWVSQAKRDHFDFMTKMRERGVDVRPVRDTPPGWAMAQVTGSAQAWVTEDSVSMVYESLTAGAATGLLAVPRLGETRITVGVADLQREGFVTSFADWQREGALHAPPTRLSEAERVAAVVLSRWPQ